MTQPDNDGTEADPQARKQDGPALDATTRRPIDTDHPTGESQAAQNREDESPS